MQLCSLLMKMRNLYLDMKLPISQLQYAGEPVRTLPWKGRKSLIERPGPNLLSILCCAIGHLSHISHLRAAFRGLGLATTEEDGVLVAKALVPGVST